MGKYRFNYLQTFVVWSQHGKKCYWCDEPLRLGETTVDHLVPEFLLDRPSELEEIRKQLNLPTDFAINDYCNWLPAHDRCNKSKGSTIPKLTFRLSELLEKLCRNAGKIKDFETQLLQDKRKDQLLGRVMAALTAKTVSKDDINALLLEIPKNEKGVLRTLSEEISIHIDSTRWTVQGITSSGMAVVSDGQRTGISPTNRNPHNSWQCGHCGSYGPWNGSICLSCMRYVDND